MKKNYTISGPATTTSFQLATLTLDGNLANNAPYAITAANVQGKTARSSTI